MINGPIAERASGSRRVRKSVDACLYAFEISDVPLRDEESEPTGEPSRREDASASSVGSTSAVETPFILELGSHRTGSRMGLANLVKTVWREALVD